MLPSKLLARLGVDDVHCALVRLQGHLAVAAVQAQLVLEHVGRHVVTLDLPVQDALVADADVVRGGLQDQHMRWHNGVLLQEGSLEARPREAIEHPALHLLVALVHALDDELCRLLLVVVAVLAHVGHVYPGFLQQAAGRDVLEAEVVRQAPGISHPSHAWCARDDDLQRTGRDLRRQALEHVVQRVLGLVDQEVLEEVIEDVIGALLLEVLLDLVQASTQVRLLLHGHRVLEGGACRTAHDCPCRP
mmetsp:Transcript_70548/g.181875  ORF Transcript_70548/g.181875 Transcript_70548/m.181875 type:complete len:247 (+) Transcript_70548:738-1478(+)